MSMEEYPAPNKGLGLKPIKNMQEAELLLVTLQAESTKIQSQLASNEMEKQLGREWRGRAISARHAIDAKIVYLKGYVRFYNIKNNERNNLLNKLSRQAFALLVQILEESGPEYFEQTELELIQEIKEFQAKYLQES